MRLSASCKFHVPRINDVITVNISRTHVNSAQMSREVQWAGGLSPV